MVKHAETPARPAKFLILLILLKPNPNRDQLVPVPDYLILFRYDVRVLDSGSRDIRSMIYAVGDIHGHHA